MQQASPSSATAPATAMASPGPSRIGSTPPEFLSSVIASREAWLASATYSGWCSRYGPLTGSPYGFSNSPNWNFSRSTRRTASSIRLVGTFWMNEARVNPSAPGSAPPITSEPALAARIQALDGSQSVVMRPV